MKKVLIADDSATIGRLLSVYLVSYYGEKNLDIIKVKDGAEALFALRDFKDIELLFLDIMMPIVDGYSVAKYIHSRELKVDTIIISSNLDKTMITSLGKIGFKHFLPKPIHNNRLRLLLDKISESKEAEPTEQKAKEPEPKEAEPKEPEKLEVKESESTESEAKDPEATSEAGE